MTIRILVALAAAAFMFAVPARAEMKTEWVD